MGIRRVFGGIRGIFGVFGFFGFHGDLLLVENLLARFRPSCPFIIFKGEIEVSGGLSGIRQGGSKILRVAPGPIFKCLPDPGPV